MTFLVYVVTFGCLLVGLKAVDRPHIVHIMADDLGYEDIGFNNAEVLTPNMDALATAGRILETHYAMPSCTPSRAALLTGVYPFKSKMQHLVIQDPTPNCVPTNLKFAPEYLKEYNYSTHLIGKWHLGFCKSECTPMSKGFDTHYGLLLGEGDHYNHTHGVGYDWREGEDLDKSTLGEYTATLITNRVVELIENHTGDESLYLFVAHTAPHEPLQAPDEFMDLYANYSEPRKSYLAMVSAFDDSVGKIVDALQAKGIWDNTFLLVSSDNGGDTGGMASNLPYRGGKASIWEGGCRTVAFVAGPLIENGGESHHGLIHHTDWLPTFISMAGGDPALYGFDGKDQSDMVLQGEDTKRWEMVYNIDMEDSNRFGQAAIRQGDYKLIWGNPGYCDGYGVTIRKFWNMEIYLSLINRENESLPYEPHLGGCKYCESPRQIENRNLILDAMNFVSSDIDSGIAKLFNLRDDPTEANDLSALPAYSDILTRMKNRILTHLDDYVEPEPLAAAMWIPQSMPSSFPGGAWTPGWCDMLNLTLEVLPEPGVPSLASPVCGHITYMDNSAAQCSGSLLIFLFVLCNFLSLL